MNKIFFASLFMVVGISVFAQSGIIKELSGTVEVKTAGALGFVPAVSGMEVAQDTLISTGFKSFALIEMSSTVIAVRPLTRLSLTEIQASTGTETINVNLQTGRVRVDVNPPAGKKASMSVTSPTATASVRGTGFEMDTRYIYVDDGTVYFKGNNGYTIQVVKGSFSSIGSYEKVSSPIIASKTGSTPPLPIGYDPASKFTGRAGITSPGESDPGQSPGEPGGPSGPSGGGGGGYGGSGTTPTPDGIDVGVDFP